MSREQTPLRQLTGQFVKIHRRAATTPVLVTPTYLSLRPPFFVALAAEIREFCRLPIRFDWCREIPGVFQFAGHVLVNRQAGQINRALANDSQLIDIDAAMQITATIGRPSADRFLIGISTDQIELPPWTTAVRLATTVAQRKRVAQGQSASPQQTFHLQSPGLVGAA